VDEGRTVAPAALVANPDTASSNRLVYRSPALGHEVRLSGRPELRLRASIDNRADANLTGYLVDYGPPGSTVFVVTRGWVDPQNRTGRDHTLPVKQGQMYDYRWTLQPKDYVFQAGHRIGLVVLSSDQEYTLLPLGGTRLTVAPQHSQLTIPVVGGRSALGF
jgi:X-Pro dipeptidyl-peptidase